MATFWLGKLSLHIGLIGRGNNDITQPWLGFYYGSWIPRFHWNSGRFSLGEVVDVGGYWICFHWSATWWPAGEASASTVGLDLNTKGQQ